MNLELVYWRADFSGCVRYGIRAGSFAAGSFFPFFSHVLFRQSCFFVKCCVAFKFVHTADVSVAHWHMLSLLFRL